MQTIEKWRLLARLQFAPRCIFSDSPCIFEEAYFLPNLRGLPVSRSKALRGRDGFTRDFGCGRHANLSGAISWLTFFAGGAADVRRLPSERQDSRRGSVAKRATGKALRASATIARRRWQRSGRTAGQVSKQSGRPAESAPAAIGVSPLPAYRSIDRD